jgi:hypothetical protein
VKSWIKFIVLPFVVSIIVQLMIAFLAGFTKFDPYTTAHAISQGVLGFVVGITIYHFAPNAKTLYAALYAVVYAAVDLAIGYTSEGTSTMVLGTQVQHHFYPPDHIGFSIGLLLGVAGARDSVKKGRVRL